MHWICFPLPHCFQFWSRFAIRAPENFLSSCDSIAQPLPPSPCRISDLHVLLNIIIPVGSPPSGGGALWEIDRLIFLSAAAGSCRGFRWNSLIDVRWEISTPEQNQIKLYDS